MVKILMHGCNGHMGQVIARLAASDSETEIIAGVDVSDHITNPYPVFKSLEDYRQAWEKDESLKADVVIDFSSAAAADKLLDYCEAVQMPVVLCTTGLTPEREDFKKYGIFHFRGSAVPLRSCCCCAAGRL